jgi:preprotein translocase subunit SecB
MSEETQAQPENNRNFAIQRIYTKDVSFETPNSPSIFTEQLQPQSDLDLNSEVNALGEDHYEIVLTVTVTTKSNDKVAFLVEVQQAGIFLLRGFEQNELGPMIGAYCPNILFPYAREVVSDLVNKGSFPQLVLAPVNFDLLYAQQVQKLQQQQQQAQKEQAAAD